MGVSGRAALEAGAVGIEGQPVSGQPNFDALRQRGAAGGCTLKG